MKIKNRDPLPFLFRLSLLGVFFAGALLAETLSPLRREKRKKSLRLRENISIGLISALTLRAVFYPLAFTSAWAAERKRIGLLYQLPAAPGFRFVLAFLLLDWSFYLWHRMLHNNGILWRLHNVHHIDLDLDASTTVRFHFGEMALTGLYRSAQVLVIGARPVDLAAYELLMMAAGFFHHSNLKLPEQLEEKIGAVLVTPRIHGMHHSIVKEETNSNFGTVFSLWDRFHGTFEPGLGKGEVIIGAPAYMDPSEHSVFNALILPAFPPRPWRMPDGSLPERREGKLVFLPDQAA